MLHRHLPGVNIGIYLALISPIVTCFLFLALVTLLACIRGSIYVSIRMCGRSTDVRRGRMSRDQRVLAKKQAKACRREFFALGRRFLFVRSMVIRILALLRFAALLSTTYEMLHYTYHFLAFTYHFLAILQSASALISLPKLCTATVSFALSYCRSLTSEDVFLLCVSIFRTSCCCLSFGQLTPSEAAFFFLPGS